MSALGLYPVDPVSAAYVFGSPLFERAEMRVAGGRLIVEARGNAPDRPYVRAVSWNGRPWTKSWIPHAAIAAGGRLVFEMGAAPISALALRLGIGRPRSGGWGEKVFVHAMARRRDEEGPRGDGEARRWWDAPRAFLSLPLRGSAAPREASLRLRALA